MMTTWRAETCTCRSRVEVGIMGIIWRPAVTVLSGLEEGIRWETE